MQLSTPRSTTRFAYGFDQLKKPGDCLTFAPHAVAYNTLSAAAYAYARRHGWRCSLETLPNGSIRVWRARPARESVAQQRTRDFDAARLENVSRILAYIASTPGRTPSEVIAALDLDFLGFTGALRWLREQGLIHSQPDGTLVAQAPQPKPVTP